MHAASDEGLAARSTNCSMLLCSAARFGRAFVTARERSRHSASAAQIETPTRNGASRTCFDFERRVAGVSIALPWRELGSPVWG